MTNTETAIKAASDRITDLFTDLKNEGYDYRLIRLALIDAAVHLWRAAINDWESKIPVSAILQGFASLILNIAEDEEVRERREKIHIVKEEP